MKHPILSTLLIFFLHFAGSNLSAQNRFNIGVDFGILNSQFDGDKLFGFNKYGLTGGLQVHYSISNTSELRFDLGYMNIGSNYANETRPNVITPADYTLLSIDMQAASSFIGITQKFRPTPSGYRTFGVTAGLRIARAFTFDTQIHNVGNIPFEFDRQNISSTTYGPDIKFEWYLTPKITAQASVYFSINNMVLNEENFVSVLRPYFFGYSASYLFSKPSIFKTRKKKKRRRR